MRVAIFSESYEPVQNGVSTSVRTLVDELRLRHHRVYIVAPHFPEHLDESPFVLRVPSLLTPFNANYPVPYPFFPKLRREFRKTNSNVLHTQSPWFLGLLAARLAQQGNMPLVSTYHTLYNYYAHYLFFLPKPAIESLLEWWLPEYYNRCTSVIVPSKVTEESLKQYGVESRIVVVPTGVPLPPKESTDESAKQQVREKYGIPSDAPLLLYVGRLAQEKNIELVLNSFARISTEFNKARLLIVGAGPYLETCQNLASELPSGNRIIFAGPMLRDEIDPLYAAADLFVFGSATETQGLVIAEARAAGTPSVVVDEGGAPEHVRHGEDGMVVPSDVNAFSRAMRSVLRDADLRGRMREACFQNSHEYTPEVMADKVLEVYEWSIWKNSQYKSIVKIT
jgi:1,2-diacylglycerol 3-alpha-glucosyltransferase